MGFERIHIARPAGPDWSLEDGARKLRLRAGLPGARLYDHAAASLRLAREGGMAAADRLALALPASWCVNSPAPSPVLRRWVLPPQREVWIALVEMFESGEPFDDEAQDATTLAVGALGQEPFAVEAISKVLALLVPEAIPLMPPAAITFVLGPAPIAGESPFVAMVRWFQATVARTGEHLASLAADHGEVPLVPAQVLDRLLWFDSDGFRHFEARA